LKYFNKIKLKALGKLINWGKVVYTCLGQCGDVPALPHIKESIFLNLNDAFSEWLGILKENPTNIHGLKTL